MLRDNYKTSAEYREAKVKERQRYYGESAFKYGSRHWTHTEDYILRSFDGTDRELSPILKRSVKAIQHRRARLLERTTLCK